MKPSRRGVGLVALAAAAALVLGACGGGGGGGGTGTVGDVSAGAPPQEGNDINPVPREGSCATAATSSGRSSSLPPQFNYNQLDGTERDNKNIVDAIMPEIFKADAQQRATSPTRTTWSRPRSPAPARR